MVWEAPLAAIHIQYMHILHAIEADAFPVEIIFENDRIAPKRAIYCCVRACVCVFAEPVPIDT